MKFKNFPNEKSNNFKNLTYYDFDIGLEHTYKIDGHLSEVGHSYIADELSKILK